MSHDKQKCFKREPAEHVDAFECELNNLIGVVYGSSCEVFAFSQVQLR